eukprot:709468-Rhodomonas_salina.1
MEQVGGGDTCKTKRDSTTRTVRRHMDSHIDLRADARAAKTSLPKAPTQTEVYPGRPPTVG